MPRPPSDLEETRVVPPSSERLDSWKEIAAYLKRDIRTVQRWEERESLPVYRHMHGKHGSVYAYRLEIDAWWNNRRPKLEQEEQQAAENESAEAPAQEVETQPAAHSEEHVLPAMQVVVDEKSPAPLPGQTDARGSLEAHEPAPQPERHSRSWRLTAATLITLAALVLFVWKFAPLLNPSRLIEKSASKVSHPAVPTPIAVSDAYLWVPLSSAGPAPGPRMHSAAAYDSASKRLIVHGGYSGQMHGDVWLLARPGGLLSRPEWIHLAPRGQSPAPRMGHTAVYDEKSNRLIVFGGRDATRWFDDLWVLTNANGLGGAPEWLELHPDGSPPANRSSHSAVYDPRSNRLILYGGLSATPQVSFSDLWVLENANGFGGRPTWKLLSSRGGGPGERHGHAAVYDQASNRMIVYGGFTIPNWLEPNVNQVWILTDANGTAGVPEWRELQAKGNPPMGRAYHSAFYDAPRNRMVVIGGNSDSRRFNDVWELTNANGLGERPEWKEFRNSEPLPEARNFHASVFDPDTDAFTVFGGQSFDRILEDLWVLAPASALPEEFEDSFNSVGLDPAWHVIKGLGGFSLSENPGHLRYRVAPAHAKPGLLVLSRPFLGDNWTLEAKVTYFVGSSGGGRGLDIAVQFGVVPRPSRFGRAVVAARWRDDWTGNQIGSLRQYFRDDGQISLSPPDDRLPVNKADSYVWRIHRQGRTIRVELSDDGIQFRQVGTHTFGTEIDGSIQFLSITGSSFANFDSFADFDYVRVTKTRPNK